MLCLFWGAPASLAAAQVTSRVLKQTLQLKCVWLKKVAPSQRRGFSEEEGPLGGSIFTGLALDVVVYAVVLQNNFVFLIHPFVCKYSAANAAVWRKSRSSQSKELFIVGGCPWERCPITATLEMCPQSVLAAPAGRVMALQSHVGQKGSGCPAPVAPTPQSNKTGFVPRSCTITCPHGWLFPPSRGQPFPVTGRQIVLLVRFAGGFYVAT